MQAGLSDNSVDSKFSENSLNSNSFSISSGSLEDPTIPIFDEHEASELFIFPKVTFFENQILTDFSKQRKKQMNQRS